MIGTPMVNLPLIADPLAEVLAAGEYGQYLAWWKAVPFLLIFFAWCKALAWSDKDAVDAHLPREPLNAGNLAGLLLAFLLFLLLPNFLLATAVFALLFAIEAGVYLSLRNQKVGLADLKQRVRDAVANLGKRGDARREAAQAASGAVMLYDAKGKPVPTPGAEDPDFAVYDAAQQILDEPLSKRAERVELVRRNGAVRVLYNVDGVNYEGRSIAPDVAGAGIEYLKRLAGMDVADRRKPQAGKLKARRDAANHDLRVKTSGSTAGETLSVEVDPGGRHAHKIDDLGLLPEQLQAVLDSMNEPGVVIVAAPDGMGLTSALYAILRRHDAFLQHLQTIERKPAADLEGITQNALETREPNETHDKFRWIASQEPDAIMVAEANDPEVVREAARFAAIGKKVYLGLRAGSTFDALNIYRRLAGADEKAATKQVKLVIAGRVMRRLCEATKVPYEPDDKTLKLLGAKRGTVERLYKPHLGPLRDANGREVPDEFCGGLGYKGRFGTYEVLGVTDEVREAVRGGGSGALRAAFRRQGQKYLQEAALARVIAGETSLQEVLRVMKSGEEKPSTKPASKAAK